MRNDLAALIPPFVVAVVFIVGVVAFLRREMGPRRRRADRDRHTDMPGTSAAGTSRQSQHAHPDQAGEDAAEIDDGGDGGADSGTDSGSDSGVSSRGDTGVRSSDAVVQEPPSAS
jgi:hypothetical protein